LNDPITPIITIDPFKLAEWMGWGYGVFKQAVFRLPANTSVALSLDIPDNEVWWFTYSIIGDVPPSALTLEVSIYSKERTIYEHHPAIVIHEGWVGTPLCPPGWHRAEGKGGLSGKITNVTGNTSYNDLPAQEVFVHFTLLVFKIRKDKVAIIDKLLEKMLEGVG
jgi:hypothetical protein